MSAFSPCMMLFILSPLNVSLHSVSENILLTIFVILKCNKSDLFFYVTEKSLKQMQKKNKTIKYHKLFFWGGGGVEGKKGSMFFFSFLNSGDNK